MDKQSITKMINAVIDRDTDKTTLSGLKLTIDLTVSPPICASKYEELMEATRDAMGEAEELLATAVEKFCNARLG